MTIADRQLLAETEELLERMKHVEPLSREEVCDWLDIRPQDFPGWAQANLERELEQINAMARVYRDRRDRKSVTLVRQIDQRIGKLKGWISDWSEIAADEGP
jgi:hypothetical protein